MLLVIDSVICAFGRLGTWLGYERWTIEPDLVVLAKGITSGYLPLGAVLVSEHGRRAVLARRRAGRCSATARPTPATRPAAWPRMANLDILERENLSRAAASSRAC